MGGQAAPTSGIAENSPGNTRADTKTSTRPIYQLLSYKTALENPPLLVVCDFDEYRIYPQWTNTNAEPFIFRNKELVQPSPAELYPLAADRSE